MVWGSARAYAPVMRRLHLPIVLLAAGLVAAACSGEAVAPPEADGSTTLPAPVTTMPPSTTTTVTTVPPATTTSTLPPAPGTAEEAGLPWWNDRVFYQVFVRSFADSDGDGIGDLQGLTDRLDYLNDGDPATTDDLGVTGIWLMPVFESPSYHGYDVVDYRAIESDYGTLEDFETFLAAARGRGIAVVVDLVINHTSVEHPWFEASRDPQSPYADWYLWEEADPGFPGPWGQTVWHPLDGRFYYGLFWEGMPDLNLESPEVTAEIEDIGSYWLGEVGVDGFRLDAARHLIEDGEVQEDTPETIAWLEGFQRATEETAPGSLLVGEVWSPSSVVAGYIPDALDLAFEFDLAEGIVGGLEAGSALGIRPVVERVVELYPQGQYAAFLSNHDQPRVMSRLFSTERAAAAAVLMLTNPGVPFLYYGEEIGLKGIKPDPRIRTPMPWTGEAPGHGFTEAAEPWEPFWPEADEVNVAAQDGSPGSLLSIYRDLIHFRNGSAALRYGDFVPVETGSGPVYAYLRTIGDDHVLVVVNVSRAASGVTLDLEEGPLAGVATAESVIGPEVATPEITSAGGLAGYRPVETLAPFEALIVQFGR